MASLSWINAHNNGRLSIYVLESSSSRRLTYFMPPLVSAPNTSRQLFDALLTDSCQNLIPLLCIRPLRLVLSAEALRRVRIGLLKVTHLPFVAIILAYEATRPQRSRRTTQTPPTAALSTIWRGESQARRAFSGKPELIPSRATALHPAVREARSLGSSRRRGSSPVERRSETRGSASGPAESALTNLIDEVDRLRRQVDQITATAAFEQRTN
jgi:hypothetical protein